MKKTKLLWYFFSVLIIINIILTVFNNESPILLFMFDLLPVLTSVIAIVFLFATVKKLKVFDTTKLSWLLILIGIVFYFAAETIYGIFDFVLKLDADELFPTIADWFWLVGYIPIFMGLALLTNRYRKSGFPMGSIKRQTLTMSAILILFLLVIWFVLVPILNDNTLTVIEKFFYLFYPIADLLIVTPALLLVLITSLYGKGLISKPWKLLAFGFVIFTIADLLYSYLDFNSLYSSGSVIDIGWNVGYLLIALAGFYQIELIGSLNGGEGNEII